MQNPQGYGSPSSGAPSGNSSTGLQPNIAALLAYVLTWVTGLIFFLIEKQNRFVRFHAMQAILLGAVVVVTQIVLTIIGWVLGNILGLFSLLTGLLSFVVMIGFLIGWIFCMIKAYQGQMFKLPVIGDMAENIVNK